MALLIVYRSYPLPTWSEVIIDVHFYVYCMVCYFTDRTRLPRSSNLWTCQFNSHLLTWVLMSCTTSTLWGQSTYLNHHYLACWPVSFFNSTHSLLWLCCKNPDHQQWSYPPADTLPDALPFTQPSTSIDSAVISSKWINLILFYCFIIYLIWLVIILLICACILSLSSS